LKQRSKEILQAQQNLLTCNLLTQILLLILYECFVCLFIYKKEKIMSTATQTGLRSMLGQYLSGWKIIQCFYARINHDLMGMHPLLHNESIVFCTSLSDLATALRKAEPKKFLAESITILYCPQTKTGFNLAALNDQSIDDAPFNILDSAQIEQGTFVWAAGVFGASITAEEYERSIATQTTNG
jgi:hypothetical protein